MLNVEYFRRWTPNMAYILGFITADAGMHYHGYNGLKSPGYKLAINIQYKDKEILEFIRDEVAPENKIYEYSFGDVLQSGVQRHQSALVISSKKMMDDLIELGITPQKTGKEVLPSIPDQLKPDYLRGLFDGDGSITVSTQLCKKNNKRYGKYTFKIVSASESFLKDVKKIGLNLGGGILPHPPGCYKWQIQSKEEVLTIGKFLYYDGFPFSLNRKYAKFLELIQCQ